MMLFTEIPNTVPGNNGRVIRNSNIWAVTWFARVRKTKNIPVVKDMEPVRRDTRDESAHGIAFGMSRIRRPPLRSHPGKILQHGFRFFDVLQDIRAVDYIELSSTKVSVAQVTMDSIVKISCDRSSLCRGLPSHSMP